MEKADFIHLVRLSEKASAEDSAGYRRSVAVFAALGYLWVAGCLALAILILAVALSSTVSLHFRFGTALQFLMGGTLLLTTLRALWLPLDPPEGVKLQPKDAPALFEALERIRRKIKGPPIDCVQIDGSFNASITQLPRFGLLGGTTNYLTIGLPILMALDKARFLAVMSHEYGHLRGGHGRFSAWIYRTRLSWTKLEHGLGDSANIVTAATQAFLRWYFPRFMAKTFAMARQDEYEADRIAGKLLGREVAGAALTEIAIKGRWLQDEFWPQHWSAALHSFSPVGPFAAMRTLLTKSVNLDYAKEALRQSLSEISDVVDTHPVLRDRLEALDVLHAGRQLPYLSSGAALELLGAGAGKWVAHFDREWIRDNAVDWKQHHNYLRRVQARVAELQASLPRNNAKEMTQLGDLQLRLNAKANVLSCYERALQLSSGYAKALYGMAAVLPEGEFTRRMEVLGQLFDTSPPHQWWASQTAVQILEKRVAAGRPDDKDLKQWRERLKQSEAAEQRAWEELVKEPFFQSIQRHDLDDFEMGELQSGLAQCKPVRRAWFVNKSLKEFAYRRCFILFVELPGMADEDRHDLCRNLEQTLDVPGPLLVLWAGHSPTLSDIQRNAFTPIYVRSL